MGNLNPAKRTIFIDEIISVIFEQSEHLIKKPVCPDKFIWKGQEYIIGELINEWQDFSPNDSSSANPNEPLLKKDAVKGSFGVGRFYFRVRTTDCRVFDLYYDRKIKNVSSTEGFWVLYQEILNL
jgi:hypothetical protein